MEHEDIDGAWVQDLVDRNLPEGQHIEFKAGKKIEELAQNSAKAMGAFFRRYVFGFANGDGGLLVIGVGEENRDDEKTRRLTVAPIVANSPTDRQIGQYLESAAGLLHPPHRTARVEVDGGVVLVVGCLRAPRLIPAAEKGSVNHWMRIQDQTLKVPPFLLTDLSLGRRAQPIFDVRMLAIRRSDGGRHIALLLENASLTHASAVQATVLATGRGRDRLRPTLTPFVDAPQRPHVQECRRKEVADLPALAVMRIRTFEIPPPKFAHCSLYGCALVVTARECDPQWFQVWIHQEYRDDFVRQAVVPVRGERCVLGEWHQFGGDDAPQDLPELDQLHYTDVLH